MVLPKMVRDNLCPNLLAPSVLYLNLIMLHLTKEKWALCIRSWQNPQTGLPPAVQARHQPASKPLNPGLELWQYWLSVHLQSNWTVKTIEIWFVYSTARPSRCNCKGGMLSRGVMSDMKRGWRLSNPPISKPAKADAYNCGVYMCIELCNVQWPPKRRRCYWCCCRMHAFRWAIQFKYLNSSADREMYNDPRKRMLKLTTEPGCPLYNL